MLSNLSNSSIEFDDELTEHQTTFIGLQLTIGLITIIGSLLVLTLFHQTKHPSSTASRKYFIVLPTTDLQTGIICTATQLISATGFRISDLSCVISIALVYYIVFANLFLFVAMTIDRYFAITRPLKYKVWSTSNLTYLIIVICYICGIGIGFLCYYTRKDTSMNPNVLCFVANEVVSDLFCRICICLIVIPCMVIFLYAYVKMFKIIMNSVSDANKECFI